MEKDQQGTNYAAILADMEAKLAALASATAAMRSAIASGALGGPGDVTVAITGVGGKAQVGSVSAEAISLPRGALLGKSATEAIKLYLESVKRKQTNKEISDALKQGGVESTSKNFDSFVNSGLFRLKETGELLRFDDGWGLSSWYPESFRTRVSEKSDTGKRKPKRKQPAKTKAPGPATEAKAKSVKSPQGAGLEQRIEAFLRTDPARVFSDVDIVYAVGGSVRSNNLSLGRMVKKGKALKRKDGYQAPGDNLHEMPKAG
jgi:hypothetical protein